MTPYYQDDSATIYHGDCREILPELGPVDLVLTDPPYAVSVRGSSHKGQPGKGVRKLDFFPCDRDWEAVRGLVVEALTLCPVVETASFYVWCGHRYFGDVVALLEGAGMSTRHLVWAKSCPPPAPPGSGWGSASELCVYGSPSGRTWNHRSCAPSNVLESDSYRHGQPGKVPHPTQKPLRLFNTIIEASSTPSSMVLDPFMGSGTTLRAAKDLGRRSIGIEIEEKYCEIAAKRLAQEVLL